MQDTHTNTNTASKDNDYRRPLRILQYNIGKRRTVMLDLFNSEDVSDVDIIAIQEPGRNSESKVIPNMDKERFELVSPTDNSAARVCFFVNKKAALASWNYKTHSGDLATLHVDTTDGRRIQIHNIYNQTLAEGTLPTIKLLANVTGASLNNGGMHEQMIVGDFNLHHPIWGGDQAKTDRGSDELLDITESLSMDQILPRGTPTYTENCSTTIDLVFATLADQMPRCLRTRRSLRPPTNHDINRRSTRGSSTKEDQAMEEDGPGGTNKKAQGVHRS